MMNKLMPTFFRLGELVSNIQERGIYHKDMKLNNIGFRENGDIIFCDFADVEKFDYPYKLDLEKMSVCIMPIMREKTFKEIAEFRAGYIYSGGEASEKVFRHFYQKELSSLDFWYDGEVKYTKEELDIDYDKAIEWKKYSNKNELFINFITLDEYEKGDIRKMLSQESRYYLDKYFLYVYYNFFAFKLKELENQRKGNLFDIKQFRLQQSIIMANLAIKECIRGLYDAAYIYLELTKNFMAKYEIEENNLTNITQEKLKENNLKMKHNKLFLENVIRKIFNNDFNIYQIDWIAYDIEFII